MSEERSIQANLKLSDWINIVLLVISLVGLFIAVSSYWVAVSQLEQASKDSEEQRQSLDASRAHLHTAIDAARKQQEILSRNLEISKAQQELLAKNLETSKAQLGLLEEQWKRELERQSRRPSVELSLATNKGAVRLDDLQKEPAIEFPIEKNRNWSRLNFLVVNKGKEAVMKPMIRMEAYPTTVFLDRADQRASERADHSALQYSGCEILDIEPFDITGAPSSFLGDVTVPDKLEMFDIKFVVIGKSLPRKEQIVHFKVVR